LSDRLIPIFCLCYTANTYLTVSCLSNIDDVQWLLLKVGPELRRYNRN